MTEQKLISYLKTIPREPWIKWDKFQNKVWRKLTHTALFSNSRQNLFHWWLFLRNSWEHRKCYKQAWLNWPAKHKLQPWVCQNHQFVPDLGFRSPDEENDGKKKTLFKSILEKITLKISPFAYMYYLSYFWSPTDMIINVIFFPSRG